MIYPIYSINDALVGFQSPAIMHNDAFAMRNFAEVFAGVKNPADYSLWKVGEFDSDTGELTPCIPAVICRATDFVKENEDG